MSERMPWDREPWFWALEYFPDVLRSLRANLAGREVSGVYYFRSKAEGDTGHPLLEMRPDGPTDDVGLGVIEDVTADDQGTIALHVRPGPWSVRLGRVLRVSTSLCPLDDLDWFEFHIVKETRDNQEGGGSTFHHDDWGLVRLAVRKQSTEETGRPGRAIPR